MTKLSGFTINSLLNLLKFRQADYDAFSWLTAELKCTLKSSIKI